MSQDTSSRNAGSARAARSEGTGPHLVAHTRARELLEWLLPAATRFPREQRHTTTEHLCRLAMRTHDALIAARHADVAGRGVALREADTALDQLRQYLHLAWKWQWLSDGQFRHVSGLTEELGRLIGGWRRSAARGIRATGQAKASAKKEATPP